MRQHFPSAELRTASETRRWFTIIITKLIKTV